MPITVVLHNIRSTYNVGAILRTAEGLGVAKVVYSGYTPRYNDPDLLPHLREKLNRQIAKAALGAEKLVTQEYLSKECEFTKRERCEMDENRASETSAGRKIDDRYETGDQRSIRVSYGVDEEEMYQTSQKQPSCTADQNSPHLLTKWLKCAIMEGYSVVGLENNLSAEESPKQLILGSDRLPDGTEVDLDRDLVLILGEEVHGIPAEVRALVDYFLEIPMLGEKESFNVSVATGIALWALTFRAITRLGC